MHDSQTKRRAKRKTKSFVSLSNVQAETETNNAGVSIQIPGFNRIFAEYVMNSTGTTTISSTPPTKPAIIVVVFRKRVFRQRAFHSSVWYAASGVGQRRRRQAGQELQSRVKKRTWDLCFDTMSGQE